MTAHLLTLGPEPTENKVCVLTVEYSAGYAITEKVREAQRPDRGHACPELG